MSDHAELIALARETLAEIDVVADRARRAVISHVMVETGQEIAVQQPSIMDATRTQLIDANNRAVAAREAMRLIFGFTWTEQEYPTLGDFVGALPEDVRERIADHLIQAGLS